MYIISEQDLCTKETPCKCPSKNARIVLSLSCVWLLCHCHINVFAIYKRMIYLPHAVHLLTNPTRHHMWPCHKECLATTTSRHVITNSKHHRYKAHKIRQQDQNKHWCEKRIDVWIYFSWTWCFQCLKTMAATTHTCAQQMPTTMMIIHKQIADLAPYTRCLEWICERRIGTSYM